MELKNMMLSGIDFLKAEPIVSIVVIGIVAVLFYFRTKAMLRILALFLVLGLLYYFVTYIGGMTSAGVSQKETLIERSQQ